MKYSISTKKVNKKNHKKNLNFEHQQSSRPSRENVKGRHKGDELRCKVNSLRGRELVLAEGVVEGGRGVHVKASSHVLKAGGKIVHSVEDHGVKRNLILK